MLSPGAGRQGLGLPPRSEILKLVPHPSWNLQEGVESFQRGPWCWGLASVACSGSRGLLATAQQLLPALTAVLWPALCRKARSISSAEATWMRKEEREGVQWEWGTQRQSGRHTERQKEERDITGRQGAQDTRKQRGERQWRGGERGPDAGNKRHMETQRQW